jgi:hypothetical protein
MKLVLIDDYGNQQDLGIQDIIDRSVGEPVKALTEAEVAVMDWMFEWLSPCHKCGMMVLHTHGAPLNPEEFYCYTCWSRKD